MPLVSSVLCQRQASKIQYKFGTKCQAAEYNVSVDLFGFLKKAY